MAVIGRGRVKGKSIVFSKALGYPEGTEVYVRVETVEESQRAQIETPSVFVDLPFFGIWADRPEMRDSAGWVNEERASWQTRSDQRD